jgi:hypothetical protein
VLAGENALIFSFARHYCAAMDARFGKVPVLKAEDLQATELRAQTLLADGPRLKQVEKLGAVQFALGGILKAHYFGGIGVTAAGQRVFLGENEDVRPTPNTRFIVGYIYDSGPAEIPARTALLLILDRPDPAVIP